MSRNKKIAIAGLLATAAIAVLGTWYRFSASWYSRRADTLIASNRLLEAQSSLQDGIEVCAILERWGCSEDGRQGLQGGLVELYIKMDRFEELATYVKLNRYEFDARVHGDALIGLGTHYFSEAHWSSAYECLNSAAYFLTKANEYAPDVAVHYVFAAWAACNGGMIEEAQRAVDAAIDIRLAGEPFAQDHIIMQFLEQCVKIHPRRLDEYMQVVARDAPYLIQGSSGKK